MNHIKKTNIRDNEIAKVMAKYINPGKPVKVQMNLVFVRQQTSWKYLIGRFTINPKTNERAENQEYPGYAFVNSAYDFETLESFINKLSHEGVFVAKGFPPLCIKGNNWSEALTPSSHNNGSWPTRTFGVSIGESGHYSEEKLIGYQMPFYESPKELIKSLINLNEFYGSSDAKLGSLFIEVNDFRGRLITKDNRLGMDSETSSYITGFTENKGVRTEIKISDDSTTPWDNESIDHHEVWLVDKNNEVLDFISSSHPPHNKLHCTGKGATDKRIKSLIDCGENDHCEFKAYIDCNNQKAKDLEKTVCAFSNNIGGTLIIGVSDDGDVEGVNKGISRDHNKNIESYVSAIAKRLNECLLHSTCFTIEIISVRGEELVVIEVSVINKCNMVMSDRTAYIRKGATSSKATPDEITRLHNRSSEKVF